MKKLLVITSLWVSLGLLASCKTETGDEKKGEGKVEQPAVEEEHEEHENPGTASPTSEQIKSIGVEMGTIEEKELTAALKATVL